MKQYYVYLTTNLLNGKQYIGDHKINFKEKKYYFGSGLLITKALKKYGEQNFIKVILEWFDTKEEAFNAQEKYINEFKTLQPNGYNISLKGGNQITGSLSPETIEKIRKKCKGKSAWNKGKSMSDECKEKMSKSHLGLHHSGETKEKIGKGGLGKKTWINVKSMSKESREKISQIHTGMKASEQTRLKMSSSQKKRFSR